MVRADERRGADTTVAGPGNEEVAGFSPDGRWVIYASDESGRLELYLTSFPDGEGRRQFTRAVGPPRGGFGTPGRSSILIYTVASCA